MIPQETVELILDTAKIEDVVGDYVTLKRRGASFVACCPFHNEKTPSFYVTPSKGIYKCFGCGKAGTAVGFVMEQEHCSYAEALRYLAKRYNIEVVEEEESAEVIAQRQRSESLLLVCEYATRFYADQLSKGEGHSVGYAYYKQRGIEDSTIQKFGLGWAPSGRRDFLDAAIKAGYKEEYILAAGLAVQREDGTLVDKFRERVMFPIHSVSGRVIAFSGRTLKSDNPAKYVNSPETEIYIKSRNLLGIYFAKSEISRQDRCILVEGNVDMVMMHQLGITNVVASCGTSLTVEQIRLIKKFTENVCIMYDGDSAGIHAAVRGTNMVLEEGLNVRIVLLPDGDDPDSFCRRHTLDEVNEYISTNERDFISFKTDLLLEQAAGDPLKKANLINDIADTISVIPDAVKRSTYVEATSVKFGIEASILFDRINRNRREAQQARQREAQREAQRSEVARVSDENAAEPVKVVEANDIHEENKVLAQTERDLLYFILAHGCDVLEFESDSEYYSGREEDKPTVAEFISEALEADGTRFANSVYADVYEMYMNLYDEGLGQDVILQKMMDSPDRRIADAAVQISTRPHILTVKAFENALTTTSSWLIVQVPKAIMLYAERRLQDRYDTLKRNLKGSDPEALEDVLKEMKKIQAAQLRIRQKLGRQ